MGISSNYEKKTYKNLFITFGSQFCLFVVGVLIASGILFAIENKYDKDDFNYEHKAEHDNYTSVIPAEEANYLLNHSKVLQTFAKKHNMTIKTIFRFVENVAMEMSKHYSIQDREDLNARYNEYDEFDGYSDRIAEERAEDEEYYYNLKEHKMTYLKAFVLTLSTVSSIGWGHITPVKIGGQAFTVIIAVMGIPLTLLMVISGAHIIMRLVKDLLKLILRRLVGMHESRAVDRTNIAYKPVLVLLLLAYILVVAACVEKMEDHFGYRGALWYVFMSLTTVGFGDVVQEKVLQVDQIAHKTGLAIFSMLYIVFGFIHVASVVLAFLYDLCGDNSGETYHHQIYKKNEQELVDDTDDYPEELN